MKDFFVEQKNGFVNLVNKGNQTYPFVEIFFNGKYAGAYKIKNRSLLKVPIHEKVRTISLSGYMENENGVSPFQKQINVHSQPRETQPKNNYRAGDILVACDNVGGLPYGYMGHSALVVDQENIIEAVIMDPVVRKVPTSEFTDYHPMYAHFRPKNKELGEKAAAYAENYLEKFNEHLKAGQSKPIFYFTVKTPITDEWTYIYCSKLVWLSYHYGAEYTFPLDHLWFSPEDLYTILSNSIEFELLYIHPDYQFYVDL